MKFNLTVAITKSITSNPSTKMGFEFIATFLFSDRLYLCTFYKMYLNIYFKLINHLIFMV